MCLQYKNNIQYKVVELKLKQGVTEILYVAAKFIRLLPTNARPDHAPPPPTTD